MWVAIGILLLLAGIVYPMGGLMWLNRRMGQQPRLTPRQVGLVLACNGFVPVGLILGGLGALLPRLWDHLEYRTIIGMAVLAALVALLLLWLAQRQSRQTNGPLGSDGRGTDG